MPLSTDALPTGTSYTFPIHENAAILGFTFQPSSQWKINAKVEASYDDNAYTQISPLLDIGGLLLTITDDGIPSSLSFNKRVHVAVKILKNGFNAIR